MAKLRTPIPGHIASDVLFRQDRTCCVCRERGRPIQLHHIDENPSNHAPENLAALCLHDHEETQIRGGFGRKLSARDVIRFRDDWLERVANRRSEADRLSAEAMSASEQRGFRPAWASPPEPFQEPSQVEIIALLESLPYARKAATTAARRLWDSGITLEMKRGNQEVIDVLEGLCIRLARIYPPEHFGSEAAEYVTDFVAALYESHYLLYEPHGADSAGTMASVIVGGTVIDRLADHVETMVDAIFFSYLFEPDQFDPVQWRKDWKEAAGECEEPPTSNSFGLRFARATRSIWRNLFATNKSS